MRVVVNNKVLMKRLISDEKIGYFRTFKNDSAEDGLGSQCMITTFLQNLMYKIKENAMQLGYMGTVTIIISSL